MYTYIVIDDEELTRKGIIKKLSYMDSISCIGEAENGEEGLEKIEELHPDIVVLDMQMPIMGGSELLPYLSEHYPSLPLVVISGYRNFDYIKEAISANAIDYLLKPFSREDIQKCMSSAIAKLEQNSDIRNKIVTSEEEKENAYYEYDIQNLKNLIMGYRSNDISLSSERLSFINHTHNMILLTLYFSCQSPHDKILNWLNENGFGELILSLNNSSNPQMEFLILFIPEHSSLNISTFITHITETLIGFINQQNTSLLIGVSKTHKSLSELNTAFHETSDALNNQLLNVNMSTCYYYRENDKDTPPRSIFWDRQEEFLFRIEAGMSTEVHDLVEQLFEWFLTIPDLTLADVKYFCYHLSDQCKIILNYYLNQADTLSSSESIQNIINHIFQLNELKTYYLQFFLNITDMLKSQSIYTDTDVIKNIQTYIQRNYQKNLTQEFVASLFYLNRSYLSTLFKKKTGMKFIDYLNEIRIEKSKKLLLNSERKMYSIAKSVGYDNVKYFFRIFKKKTGMTPEQYRKLASSQ